MKDKINCDICEWSCGSKESLDTHLQEKHIEHLKRKIIKEQPIKCYICGFQSTSETAFQIHTEEKHNQIYNIQRETSVTKSPPTKKVKSHHDVEMEIYNEKDKEIMELKSTVNLLKQKLQNVENNMTKSLTPTASGTTDLNISSGISNNENTYKCEKCEKVITNRSWLIEQ